MIPVRDNLVCHHRPVLTWVLIAMNAAIFLAGLAIDSDQLYALYQQYGLMPARFTHPEAALEAGLSVSYWPFLSHIFLHSSWPHLIFTMWLLWIFGDNIEDRMGPLRYLLFYCLCGLLAGLLHQAMNPESVSPAIGASGALAGIFGAYYFLFPGARIVISVFFLPIFFELPAIALLGLWVILQLYHLTTALAEVQTVAEVAWWGHVGGFIAGVFLHPLFLRPIKSDSEI